MKVDDEPSPPREAAGLDEYVDGHPTTPAIRHHISGDQGNAEALARGRMP